MNFLIQGKDNCPDFDFGFELIQSIKYQEEMNGDFSREYVISEDTQVPFHTYKYWCPVGSVEFVHQYFKDNDIPIPKPVNIPEELWRISGLDPRVIRYCDGFSPKNKIFIKNIDQIKHPQNGVTKEIDLGNWQVTDYIEGGFDSEWRCFIFNGKLLDVKLYLGEWDSPPPSGNYIENTIRRWKSAPCAYTLDIGCKNNQTIVNDGDWSSFNVKETEPYIIECHNFYSCGLYGFSWPQKYPQMLSQWYLEYLSFENFSDQ